MSDIEKVKKLRQSTGAGFKDCNLALKEAKGNLEKAAEITINHTNQYSKRQETWFKHQYNSDYRIINFRDNIDKYISNVLSLYNKLY